MVHPHPDVDEVGLLDVDVGGGEDADAEGGVQVPKLDGGGGRGGVGLCVWEKIF